MNLDEETLKNQAQAILDNPALDVILSSMEIDAVNGMVHSDAGDDKIRLQGVIEIRVIRNFKAALRAVVKRGDNSEEIEVA